jgi:hypothetical protein
MQQDGQKQAMMDVAGVQQRRPRRQPEPQSVANSTPGPTRIRASLTSISITPQALIGGAMSFIGLAGASAVPSLLSAPI